MLTKEDGSIIAIDLELTYVAYSTIDAAYFANLAHLSRDQIKAYAKSYLEESGFDASDKAVREFVWDIEMAKITLPATGMVYSVEGALMSKNIGYESEFLKDACSLYAAFRADGNQEVFDLVVDHGLFNAMFLRNSPEFKAAYEKYGKYCPFFDPKFFENMTLYDKMFQMKEGFKPEDMFNVLKGMPEIVAAKDPKEGEDFVRLNDNHWYYDKMKVETIRSHMSNFRNEGDDYTIDVCIGVKPEIPYILTKWTCNMKFKQFKDESWACRFSFDNYQQFALAEDLRPVLVQNIVDIFDQDILSHFRA